MRISTQAALDREMDTVNVLLIIANHAGIKWSISLIRDHTGLSALDMERVVNYAAQSGFVWIDRGAITLTQDGLDYLEATRNRPELDTCASLASFKQEALTGITEERGDAGFMVSRQSKLTRAVLTGSGKRPKSGCNADSHIIEADMSAKFRIELSDMLGMSQDELATKMREGRIKVCVKCGEIAEHHKDGKYTKSHCIECRKKARRKANGKRK